MTGSLGLNPFLHKWVMERVNRTTREEATSYPGCRSSWPSPVTEAGWRKAVAHISQRRFEHESISCPGLDLFRYSQGLLLSSSHKTRLCAHQVM